VNEEAKARYGAVARHKKKIDSNCNISYISDSLILFHVHTGVADKSLARPTSRCILFDGENISFDASLVIYIYE